MENNILNLFKEFLLNESRDKVLSIFDSVENLKIGTQPYEDYLDTLPDIYSFNTDLIQYNNNFENPNWYKFNYKINKCEEYKLLNIDCDTLEISSAKYFISDYRFAA